MPPISRRSAARHLFQPLREACRMVSSYNIQMRIELYLEHFQAKWIPVRVKKMRYNNVLHSAGSNRSQIWPIACQRASMVLTALARRWALSFAKAISIGFLMAFSAAGLLWADKLSMMTTSPFSRVGASWV